MSRSEDFFMLFLEKKLAYVVTLVKLYQSMRLLGNLERLPRKLYPQG